MSKKNNSHHVQKSKSKEKGEANRKKEDIPTIPQQEMIIIREGEEFYGILLDYVDEIKRDITLTEAPNLGEFVSGITEIMGNMVPVINFSNLIGLKTKGKRKTPVLIVKISNQIIGLQVDEVIEIVKINKEKILSLPDIFPPMILSGAYDYNNKVVGILRSEGLIKGKHIHSLKDSK